MCELKPNAISSVVRYSFPVLVYVQRHFDPHHGSISLIKGIVTKKLSIFNSQPFLIRFQGCKALVGSGRCRRLQLSELCLHTQLEMYGSTIGVLQFVFCDPYAGTIINLHLCIKKQPLTCCSIAVKCSRSCFTPLMPVRSKVTTSCWHRKTLPPWFCIGLRAIRRPPLDHCFRSLIASTFKNV